jgi:hypothetical protein
MVDNFYPTCRDYNPYAALLEAVSENRVPHGGMLWVLSRRDEHRQHEHSWLN